MISRYFDVVRATDTPDNYLSVGYDVDVIEHKHETIQSDKSRKLVSLEKGDILVGTVKQQVALFVGDFEAYAQQGWKVLRLKDGSDIDVVGVFLFMNTIEFTRQLRNAYQGESVNNLIPRELVKLDVDIRWSRGQMTKDFMLQIRFRKLVERRIFLIKEIKKGMMQKMFPKNGSKIPELRFPGYADAWVKCKLGDVGKTFTGLSGKTKEDFGHGEGKFVTYINVFKNPISDLNELENVEIDDNQAQVNYGDVLFTTSSETPDEVGMSSVWLGKQDNIYLNSFCFGYRPQLVFDYIYLAFMLRSPSIRNHFMLLAQGISRYNISKNKAMEISVPIPELNEQTKIGEFFKHLDDLITVNERELNLLEEHKKGYLQKKFV